jgi:hypothetical protein
MNTAVTIAAECAAPMAWSNVVALGLVLVAVLVGIWLVNR